MNAVFHFIRRIMPYIFWLGVIATILVTLMPSHDIPRAVIFWDKAQHALAFGLLMFTGGVAYAKKAPLIFICLVLYGVSIELLQKYFTSTRSGDFFDVIADVTGILIGWILFILVYRLTHRQDSQ